MLQARRNGSLQRYISRLLSIIPDYFQLPFPMSHRYFVYRFTTILPCIQRVYYWCVTLSNMKKNLIISIIHSTWPTKTKITQFMLFLKRLWFQCQNIFDTPVVSLVQKTTITPTTNTPSPPNRFATCWAILEIWLSKHTDSGLRITPSMMCSWAKFCTILCEKFCNILYYRINYTLLWHLHLPVISNLR